LRFAEVITIVKSLARAQLLVVTVILEAPDLTEVERAQLSDARALLLAISASDVSRETLPGQEGLF